MRRNALEALSTIVHNHPRVLKDDIKTLMQLTVPETTIRPELITEVDLGPFKHKVDNGLPIRKASYSLIDTMLEKVPERLDVA